MTDPRETDHERHRRSIRLREYDYSENGAYFVTICTYNRKHLFGEIQNGEMRLNDAGNIAKKCWQEIPNHYPFVLLDAFVIMPNHIHGILIFEHAPVGAPMNRGPVPVCESNSIPDCVGANNHLPCVRVVPDPVSDAYPRLGTKRMNAGSGQAEMDSGFRANGGGFRATPKVFGAPLRRPDGTSGTVGAVVRGFKIGVTKWCRTHARANMVWQRNYYERIIRDDGEWGAFREYIEKNPEMWGKDELNSPHPIRHPSP